MLAVGLWGHYWYLGFFVVPVFVALIPEQIQSTNCDLELNTGREVTTDVSSFSEDRRKHSEPAGQHRGQHPGLSPTGEGASFARWVSGVAS